MSEKKNRPSDTEATVERPEAEGSSKIAEAIGSVRENPALWNQHVEPVIADRSRLWAAKYNVDRDDVASQTRYVVLTKFDQVRDPCDETAAGWISSVARNFARGECKKASVRARTVPTTTKDGRENPRFTKAVGTTPAFNRLENAQLVGNFSREVHDAIGTIRTQRGRDNAHAVLEAIQRYHVDGATTWTSLINQNPHFNTHAARLRKKVRQHVDAKADAGTITTEEHATYVQFIDRILYQAINRAEGGKARHAAADDGGADDTTRANGHDMKKNPADDARDDEATGPVWIPQFDAPDKEEGLDMATAPPANLAHYIAEHSTSPQALIARSERGAVLARTHPAAPQYRTYEFSGSIVSPSELPEDVAQIDPGTGTIAVDLNRFQGCDIQVHDGARFRLDAMGVRPLGHHRLQEMDCDISDDPWLAAFTAQFHAAADPWSTAWRAGAYVRMYAPSARSAQQQFDAIFAGTMKLPAQRLETWARAQAPEVLAAIAARAVQTARSSVLEMRDIPAAEFDTDELYAWCVERDDLENIRLVVAAADLSEELDDALRAYDELGEVWMTERGAIPGNSERLLRADIGVEHWWKRIVSDTDELAAAELSS